MKIAGIFLSLLLFAGARSFSQTCVSGNCSNGYGKFQYANGDVYEGEFYDDKREDFGIYTWQSGDKFIGESLQNMFNGFGVMEFADGTKYIGDFKDGEFDGEGEKTYTNGTSQKGLFGKGKYLGKISYYSKPIGTTGCLNGDCENGYGMHYSVSNNRFFGYFTNGKRDKFGAYYWEDGTRWVGQFSDGLLTGYGTYFFITGEKYVSNFVDSKRNGWGINYDPASGIKKIGFWLDNKLVTPKKELLANGGTTGCISGDCKNGYGKYVYNNGYYEGYFKNGYRNGNGKYYFDIGDFYDGNFTDNKFNGRGTYYYTNGERYAGEWKDQRHHGKGQLFHFDGLPEEGYWDTGKFQGANTKPAGYDAWVKNNYGNNEAVVTNTTPPPPPVNNKPNNNKPSGNTGNKPQGNNPVNNNTSGLNTTNYKKKPAQVIGNQGYRYTTPLRNPKNDARSMSQLLRESGFEVIEIIDGDQTQVKNAIKEFGYKPATYQVGLFYYSGHGIQIDDQNYIIPVDANLKSKTDVKDDCPSVSWVLRRMEDANTKLNIVILDACRNNPFGRGSFGEGDEDGGLAPISPPDNTVISFATDPGSVASDGVAGSNGLYTESLIKYIAVPNTQLENVFKLTGKEVKEKSSGKQKPWLNSNFYDIFYFRQ
ncbi:MAG: caspase family protein [Chitinophagaceae bacterium]|nr:caspase family protein [Chitinophagaceae bacterium]